MAIDVEDLDCDFCVCSTFKFFGPHCGMLFGKSKLMKALRPYKLSVCADTLPGPPYPNQFHRWETGTLNFEGLAGIAAVIDYIASLGDRFSTSPGTKNILIHICIQSFLIRDGAEYLNSYL